MFAVTIVVIIDALFDFIRCDPIEHVWNPTIDAKCWVSTEGFATLSIVAGSKYYYLYRTTTPADLYRFLCCSRLSSRCNALVHSVESSNEAQGEASHRCFHESWFLVSLWHTLNAHL